MYEITHGQDHTRTGSHMGYTWTGPHMDGTTQGRDHRWTGSYKYGTTHGWDHTSTGPHNEIKTNEQALGT